VIGHQLIGYMNNFCKPLMVLTLVSCQTEFCPRIWDGQHFRCMTQREVCKNYPSRCKLELEKFKKGEVYNATEEREE
jgi:hypothetical protein